MRPLIPDPDDGGCIDEPAGGAEELAWGWVKDRVSRSSSSAWLVVSLGDFVPT